MVDDQLQKIETDTCGIFQLYFYVNMFMPLENSSIVNDKKLSKSILEKLLNEIFVSWRGQKRKFGRTIRRRKTYGKMLVKNESCQCLLTDNLRLSKIVGSEQAFDYFYDGSQMTMQTVKKCVSWEISVERQSSFIENCSLLTDIFYQCVKFRVYFIKNWIV